MKNVEEAEGYPPCGSRNTARPDDLDAAVENLCRIQARKKVEKGALRTILERLDSFSKRPSLSYFPGSMAGYPGKMLAHYQILPTFYFCLHRGFLFSKKLLTPSLKSSLVRTRALS